MLFRKKPVIIEAIQFLGKDSYEEMLKAWSGFKNVANFAQGDSSNQMRLFINTLEGTHMSIIGDFIIKGVQGEFYPCKKDIFEQTYELVDGPTQR